MVDASIDSLLLCGEHGQKNEQSRPYLHPFDNSHDRLLNRCSRTSRFWRSMHLARDKMEEPGRVDEQEDGRWPHNRERRGGLER
jgi:hypothetical protein